MTLAPRHDQLTGAGSFALTAATNKPLLDDLPAAFK